jgi:hypothetical protein
MEKLTLENIAPFLPYGLKIKVGKGVREMVCDITQQSQIQTCVLISNVIESQYKPLLIKMDLTKPIIVDGKEVIPIVELAIIAFPELQWKSNGIGNATTGYGHTFYYLTNKMCFGCTHSAFTPYQIQCFQWLFEHKFDFFNFIEKNLAIDVTTLETNVYE